MWGAPPTPPSTLPLRPRSAAAQRASDPLTPALSLGGEREPERPSRHSGESRNPAGASAGPHPLPQGAREPERPSRHSGESRNPVGASAGPHPLPRGAREPERPSRHSGESRNPAGASAGPRPLPWRGSRNALPVIPAKAGIQPGHRRGPTLSLGEGAGTPFPSFRRKPESSRGIGGAPPSPLAREPAPPSRHSGESRNPAGASAGPHPLPWRGSRNALDGRAPPADPDGGVVR